MSVVAIDQPKRIWIVPGVASMKLWQVDELYLPSLFTLPRHIQTRPFGTLP